ALYLRIVGGYDVLAAGSLAEACRRRQEFAPQLLLLHVMRWDRVDPEALVQLDVPRGLPLLCLTGDPRPAKAAELLALGARQVLLMPMHPQRMLAFVRSLIAG